MTPYCWRSAPRLTALPAKLHTSCVRLPAKQPRASARPPGGLSASIYDTATPTPAAPNESGILESRQRPSATSLPLTTLGKPTVSVPYLEHLYRNSDIYLEIPIYFRDLFETDGGLCTTHRRSAANPSIIVTLGCRKLLDHPGPSSVSLLL